MKFESQNEGIYPEKENLTEDEFSMTEPEADKDFEDLDIEFEKRTETNRPKKGKINQFAKAAMFAGAMLGGEAKSPEDVNAQSSEVVVEQFQEFNK